VVRPLPRGTRRGVRLLWVSGMLQQGGKAWCGRCKCEVVVVLEREDGKR